MLPSHSFIALLLSLLIQVVIGVPQVTAPPALLATAVPALESSSSATGQRCGGCIIVADVDAVVWYSGVFVNTAATAVVSVGVGNGSRVTRTSIVRNEAEFTFNPAAGTAAFGTTPLAVTNVGYESETVINGATLTSPTAYNVFSAYTLTSQQLVDGGICSTTSFESTLLTAFSETLSAAEGQVTLDLAGQQAFISYLGFSRCQGGGENVGGTVLAQVSNLTATTTMFYTGVALGPMSTTLAPTTNPSSPRLPLRTTTLSEVLTTLTATLSGSSTITAVPVSAIAPNIVIGNTTITPSNNPFDLPLTFPANSTAFPAPTGTGSSGTGVIGGNGTLPFIPGSYAPVWRSDTSIWGSVGLIFLLAVGWIL